MKDSKKCSCQPKVVANSEEGTINGNNGDTVDVTCNAGSTSNKNPSSITTYLGDSGQRTNR